jgi:cytochrome c553
MPAVDYQGFADEDVAAIIAYIRSLPAVNRTLPPTELRALGRALAVSGKLPLFSAEEIALDRPHPARMVPDTSLAYGEYMANVGGCTGCHNTSLSGGPIPGTPPDWPPAANLTPKGIGHYTDAQLEHILRTGKRPDGSQVKDVMPWKFTANMTDVEMRATIKYLRTVKPREFGAR